MNLKHLVTLDFDNSGTLTYNSLKLQTLLTGYKGLCMWQLETCLALYLTGVHFRCELQHVRYMGKAKN